ncbi:hypothetical protein LEM8419_03545 [Neolewinella maritima]|uniref:DUF3168 domain-containing protein n=1 Tax=Neolewinella maritima TaxID=1383882 RepID=A0ABN8FE96_9BACT|nr:hypothetical protein [Neolewinella maritima]CAH1002673.1 hypothetical protein LEM8419_03545 [Neolewinella maritima]
MDESLLTDLLELLGEDYPDVKLVERAKEGFDDLTRYCYLRPAATGDGVYEYGAGENGTWQASYVAIAVDNRPGINSFTLLNHLMSRIRSTGAKVTEASRRSEAIYAQETGTKPTREVCCVAVAFTIHFEPRRIVC